MKSGWVSVAQARTLPGLRLVLTTGVPGPWGEAAKGVLHVRGVPFVKVPQAGGQTNEALVAWTGESNAPQAVYEDERVRTGWSEIIALAERLGKGPSLVPDDPRDRVRMYGLIHELAGEGGFGWCRRLLLFEPVMGLPSDHPARVLVDPMARRYGFSPEAARAAGARAAEVLVLLADRLRAQREAGSRYLVGDRLSALDVYWAAFAALLEPLPEALCAMAAPMRLAYSQRHPAIDAALDPALLSHRDLVYERHLELPIDLGPE